MKEFFESFFDTLKTRYRNKFIGTFFLVYLGLNWEKVAALLFISDLKYQEFIDIWTDNSTTFWPTIFLAFAIALGYLMASPWLSYFIHYIQSAAVTKYKLKSVENEMEFIEKKQHMEMQRTKLIEIQTKNVEAEANLKKEDIDNPDLIKFRKIISILSETKIKLYLMDLYDSNQREELIGSIKKMIAELSTVENSFNDKNIESLAKELEYRAADVVNFYNQNILENTVGKDNSSGWESFVKIIGQMLNAYRNFYQAAQNI